MTASASSAERESPILNVVLYQPEIPGNTGAIGRTCVALGAKLWLVRPLGFRVDQKTLRRAGLDYWQHLDWEVADHWDDLLLRLNGQNQLNRQNQKGAEIPPQPLWYFSRFASRLYTGAEFVRGDTLVFGCETNGLPESLTATAGERLLRIPTTGNVRSLNLSCSVGVAAFEAARQIGFCDSEST